MSPIDRSLFVALALVALLAAAPQESASTNLEIDRERAYIVATTGKAGALGFLGHEHGVLATDWEAELSWDPDRVGNSSLSVEVRAAELVIDTEKARRRGRLDDDGPGAEDVAEIQQQMLSPKVLSVAEHPAISFRSTAVEEREPNRLRVIGELTLVGVTREVEADVWVREIEEFVLFSSSFRIRQSDFGIEPVSIGGVVKVADEVDVRFELWTRRPDA